MRYRIEELKETWPALLIVSVIVALVIFIFATAPPMTKEDQARMQGLAIGIAVGMGAH